ncbi:MAG: hypothetical protein DWQ10_16130 [Calditrichaeota bacterium]|nr:MAG: hypothetical protein DWQ10_16130 [Calditrichota bacterium]
MLKRIIISFFSFVLILPSVGAQTGRTTNWNVRSLAMGGAGVALRSNENPLFHNPALLNFVQKRKITLVDFRVRFNQQFYDDYSFIRDNQEKFNNVNEMSDSEQNAFFVDVLEQVQKPAQLSLNGPLQMQFLQPGYGLAIVTEGSGTGEVFSGASGLPIADIQFYGETLIIGGYGISLVGLMPRPLHLGISLKSMTRWTSHKIKTITGLSDDETLDLYKGRTFSLDFGALYSLNRNVSFGVAFYDLNSPDFKWENSDGGTGIKPAGNSLNASMKLGIAYVPNWRNWGAFKNISFAADLNHPFDSDITFFKKLFLGAEANLPPFFHIGTGFYQGYTSFGIGLDIRWLRLDFAMYGEEMGKYAGDVVNWNKAFSLQLGF